MPSPDKIPNNKIDKASEAKIDSIRSYSRYPEYDWRANAFVQDVNHLLKTTPEDDAPPLQIEKVRTLKVYYLNSIYSSEQLEGIARHLICDTVIEDYSLNGFPLDGPQAPYIQDFDFMVEVAYLPGVVDNEGKTFQSALRDYLKKDFSPKTHTASGIIYLLKFLPHVEVKVEQVRNLFTSMMVNILIERIEVVSITGIESDWGDCRSLFKDFFQEFNISSVSASGVSEFSREELYEVIPLTHIDNETALNELSVKRLLYLSSKEMRAVISYYLKPEVKERRQLKGLPLEPTDVELEVIAQTWSEHCKHKIFAAQIAYHEKGVLKENVDSLYRTYIKETTSQIQKVNSNLLSVFSDNSGVFRFTEDFAICMKVETHNSPSALDPFGGAMTGIVGVNRDILGTGIGAKPLFNTDVFCFGDLDYLGDIPPKLFHPRRVMSGVHKGVERGGNESGIPTVNGAMVFNNCFMGKPLVFCGTGGILPIKISTHKAEVNTIKKEIHPGDLIVMVGGRVGKDGIHGATFSSVPLNESQISSVVQIGDPITQKKMTDFLMVARDRHLYRTLTDNGAGGLSSSVGEMAQFSGGCDIELDKVMLKYPDLKPWEILVSESQERMTLALPPENRELIENLAIEYDVELCFIGKFTSDGFFSASYCDKTVAYLSLDFLHDGLPQMVLDADWVEPDNDEPSIDLRGEEYGKVLKGLLARPNIASKESWVRRYDHEVKALSILKPFDGVDRDAPMDAAVIKPLRDSNKGLVISNGLCPRLSDIDSYVMSAIGVDEAVRNAVAVGGNPEEMYALDNFCWPDPIVSEDNPDGKYKLAQLVRANRALSDICRSYHLPLISGKDSMKNDYGEGKSKISVLPTLLVTVLSVIPDYRKICSSHFKEVGSSIYLLGKLDGNMGGSEFYSSMDYVGKKAPQVEKEENFQVYRGLYRAIVGGWVRAAHDISDGGLAVTVAESCFGSRGGAEIDLKKIGGLSLTPWQKLFSEPAGCLVVEIPQGKEKGFLKEVGKYTNRFQLIGKTTSNHRLIVKDVNNSVIINETITELKQTWQTPL